MLEWMYWTIDTAIVVGLLFLLLVILVILDQYHRSTPSNRLLPFPTTRGDRVFISLMAMIAIGLLWLKFVPFSIWGALLVSLVVMFIIIKYA